MNSMAAMNPANIDNLKLSRNIERTIKIKYVKVAGDSKIVV
jgi:hypothetical protein